MFKPEFQMLHHNNNFKLTDLSIAKDKIYFNGRVSPFLGSAPPERVIELINLINSGNNIYSELQKKEYRNATTVLSSLGMIVKQKDILKIYTISDDYESLLAKKVLSTETIQIISSMADQDDLSSIDIGKLVSDSLGRDWGIESKRRWECIIKMV
ncbi:hypothetical protein [Peribacillus frigoritolerans]|uniref:hypothetical protein n=1 Tax=Peribacillus frigoritolerans TaxID=450367 RepID=UPI001059CCCB|nr:hypothetical protein [Peribacillus frigoritolerans]TDL83213.1 hypothetical protein E2R53_06720 [Peribacillus frigoritolerans]